MLKSRLDAFLSKVCCSQAGQSAPLTCFPQRSDILSDKGNRSDK